jgi:DNA-binding transcriptional MocR family regulator
MTISAERNGVAVWRPSLEGWSGPKYRAIAAALAEDVRTGRLGPGTRLPPQRELAWALGVTVGTVTRAYREAEMRGLVAGEVGRGTYVLGARDAADPSATGAVAPPGMEWAGVQPQPDRPAGGETVGDAPAAADGPIPMQFNFPPLDDGAVPLREALTALAADPALPALLGYQPPTGDARQQAAACRWFGLRGLDAAAEEVVVTAGAHNGILAALASLCRSGGRVATERVVYPGLRAIARLIGVELVPVDLDGEGMRPDALQAVLAQGGIDAVYCVPTLQNPTNATQSAARRADLAAVLRRYAVPVVEDDLFGLLPSQAPAPLTALVPELGYCVTSLSKTLAPGLRVGFLRCPAERRDAVAAGVRASTWMAVPLTAEIATRWILDGTAEAVLARRRAAYDARRRAAAAVLEGLDAALPDGALHAWLHLPEPWHASQFVAAAAEAGVILSGAHAFSIGRDRAPFAVRVCFGPPRSEARMLDGLRRLRAILETRDPFTDQAAM